MGAYLPSDFQWRNDGLFYGNVLPQNPGTKAEENWEMYHKDPFLNRPDSKKEIWNSYVPAD